MGHDGAQISLACYRVWPPSENYSEPCKQTLLLDTCEDPLSVHTIQVLINQMVKDETQSLNWDPILQ